MRPGTRQREGVRDTRGRVSRLLLLAAGIWLGLPGTPNLVRGGAQTDSVPRRRVYSVEDSPGYVPLADPESASAVIGRRLNAPLVSKRFQGGARSLDELGRAVCRALHRSDRDSLLTLCIRDDEFRDILWREFPQSRPVTGLAWQDGWRALSIRLLSGCTGAIRDHGGHYYEFLRFEADSVARYRNFKLYSRLTLVARGDEGQILRMRWLRTVAERKGRFKIYSTDD